MKLKRQLAAAGATAALVAGGASVALVGGMTSSSAAEFPSAAYGLQATGLIPIKAMPSVTSTTGKKVSDSLVALPSNPLLTGGIIDVQAENDHAEADVTNLAVGNGLLSQLSGSLAPLTSQLTPVCNALKQIPVNQLTGAVNQATGTISTALLQPLINAVGGTGVNLGAVTALDLSKLLPSDLSGICDVLAGKADLVGVGAVTTQCNGSTGSVNIVDLKALGLPFSVDTHKVDTKIEIPGVLKIEINRQTKNANGTFTVDGLVINLLGRAEITVTSATCGHISHKVPPGEHPSNAPTPTPIHTKAPVTG
jgi:hypothetical protein